MQESPDIGGKLPFLDKTCALGMNQGPTPRKWRVHSNEGPQMTIGRMRTPFLNKNSACDVHEEALTGSGPQWTDTYWGPVPSARSAEVNTRMKNFRLRGTNLEVTDKS